MMPWFLSLSIWALALCKAARTLRRKILQEDYEGAADEFPRCVFAAGRRLAGLIRRREAERALFLS